MRTRQPRWNSSLDRQRTAIMTLLCERLRSNDETLGPILCLDGRRFTARSIQGSLEDLAECIPHNTHITGVKIGERIVQSLTGVDLATLVQHVALFPELQHLEISLWERDLNRRKRMDASTLATFLQLARNLQSIVLWPFLWIATEQDLALLNDALYQHPTLQSLHLLNVLTPADPTTNSIHLSSLLTTVATVPHLKQLQIAPGFQIRPTGGFLGAHHPSSSEPNGSCVTELIQTAPRLESLALRNCGLTNEHIGNLATHALQRNTTLTHLDLRFNPLLTGPAVYQALVSVLKQDNLHLKHVDLDGISSTSTLLPLEDFVLERELKFYLRLNRVGRYDFLQNPQATHRDRVHVLELCASMAQEAQDEDIPYEGKSEIHLNLVFYLLQRNPSVICQAAAATTTTTKHASS